MVDNNINFALKTNNVYVHYGSKMAINNVSLDFPKNEVTSLIDGSSFSTVTTSARTVKDFVKEQGLDPEQTEVQNSSNQFMQMGDSMDPDDVYSLIARNKTGG